MQSLDGSGGTHGDSVWHASRVVPVHPCKSDLLSVAIKSVGSLLLFLLGQRITACSHSR
jgi:hypothetical protein